MSIVLPASNEAAEIDGCLRCILASDFDGPLQCIVVANGCRDETAALASARTADFSVRGWNLSVLELAEGSKPGALNAGDALATGQIRVYLDADVRIDQHLLSELAAVLDRPSAAYASGALRVVPAESAVSRAYARFYRQVPFVARGVPGCGLFAVNAAGRKRWEDFPPVISDDTFVRLKFAPSERFGTSAGYDWPLVNGFANLVRVRRRQNAGVEELRQLSPEIFANDDKLPFTLSGLVGAVARSPIGFVVYALVAVIVRMTPGPAGDWRRGR